MHFRYPLLQRMRTVDIADPLNCNNMLAINTDQRKQARINRQMFDPPLLRLQVRDLKHDCTSTASSFATSQLRALEVRLRADIIQKRPVRVRIADNSPLSVNVGRDIRCSVCQLDERCEGFGCGTGPRRLRCRFGWGW